jgi:AAA15 family ATPase/GTPase
VIYGANASGKSNIIEGFNTMKKLVVESATNLNRNDNIDVEPFLLSSESEKEPTTFEVELFLNNEKYRYGFITTNKAILREYLFRNDDYLFIRNEDDFFLSDELKQADLLIKKTRNNALFISVLAQFNEVIIQPIYDWFYNVSSIDGTHSKRYESKTYEMLKQEIYFPIIEDFIRKIDVGIIGLKLDNNDFDLIPDELKIGSNWKNALGLQNTFSKKILLQHQKFGKNGEKLDLIDFPLSKYASAGTKKIFELIGSLIDRIQNNGLVIIDEFDAQLHPFLAKSIIRLFNSDLGSNAQFIFATHSATLLDENLIRPDQVYLVEKDRFSSSQLYSIIEYKNNDKKPMQEQYLNGRYGGIPFIDDFSKIFKKEYNGEAK